MFRKALQVKTLFFYQLTESVLLDSTNAMVFGRWALFSCTENKHRRTGVFLGCIEVHRFNLLVCHSGRRGVVEGVAMPIHWSTRILVPKMNVSQAVCCPPARQTAARCSIICWSLYLVMAHPNKPLWNHTHPFIYVVAHFPLSFCVFLISWRVITQKKNCFIPIMALMPAR